MIINKKATSIVEAMVTMTIIILGVVGMYKIYFESIDLSESTKNRIQAIQIAREGIEAVTNIRDTNWLIFGADYKNCWNVSDYNPLCIGSTGLGTDINGQYIIYKKPNERWILESKSVVSNYDDVTYKSEFKVGLTGSGFYSQSGGLILPNQRIKYTREINISYPEDTNLDSVSNSDDDKMKVTSLVQWRDSTNSIVNKVELETILSNWKK